MTDDGADDDGVHVHVHMPAATAAIDPNLAASNEAGQGVGMTDEQMSSHPVIKAMGTQLDALKTMLDTIITRLPEPTTDADKDDDEGDKKDAKTEDADDGDEKKEKKETAMAGDSAALATSFHQLIADCEILVPGFKAPTMDAKAERKKTVDTMCQTRRKALDAYSATADGAASLSELAGVSVDIAGMTCDAAAMLFRAATVAKKLANNAKTTDGAGRMANATDADKAPKGPLSIAQINELNAKTYPRPT